MADKTKGMKVVIVGGVAGGATAAARIRRLDEKAEVTVFERSGFVSYANCGLPYYIGGVIEDKEALTLQTPESLGNRFNIAIKVHHEVTAIHPETKTVSVKNLASGEEFEESYDKLLLSPGARPILPPFSGAEGPRVFTLRTVEDTLKIKDFIDTKNPKSAVIIGGGFIGLEAAENMRELGMDVSIVQLHKQLMMPFDEEIAAFIHANVKKHGIELFLGYSAEGIDETGGGLKVRLKDSPALDADMAVLAVGVSPETALAKDAGAKTGIKGSIVVNERMQTSLPDIYAVGDAVQVHHSVTGENTLLALAGPANKQGRIAADNICGGDSRYDGSQGSSVIKVFDLTAAATGINERTAIETGLDYDKIYLSPANHATYYPGGKNMTVKVLFERKTGRILGAQIVGYDGVDKRIDVLATAIHANMTGFDLAQLDLAYAPPYSSAKDPVNMAGFMIDNILTGKVKQFFCEDVSGLPRDGSVTLLDVRTEDEYREGHIDGFQNIPVDELRGRLSEVPGEKPVYVNCQSGIRSYIACRILEQHGFDCYSLSGGYAFYRAQKEEKLGSCRSFPCGADK